MGSTQWFVGWEGGLVDWGERLREVGPISPYIRRAGRGGFRNGVRL